MSSASVPPDLSADAHNEVLQQLRAATAAHHQRLEDALGLDRPTLTRDKLVWLMPRMHALYAAVELGTKQHPGLAAHAEALAAVGLDWAARRKLPWLVSDLKTLELCELGAARYPVGQVALPDLSHALGCLYVLEGATLGGQVISRNFARVLGPELAPKLQFFRSYGRQVGPMWRAFCDVLRSQTRGALRGQNCVAAAVQTFALFNQELGG